MVLTGGFQKQKQLFLLTKGLTSTPLRGRILEKEQSMKGKWSGEMLQKVFEIIWIVFSKLDSFGVVDYSSNPQRCPLLGGRSRLYLTSVEKPTEYTLKKRWMGLPSMQFC